MPWHGSTWHALMPCGMCSHNGDQIALVACAELAVSCAREFKSLERVNSDLGPLFHAESPPELHLTNVNPRFALTRRTPLTPSAYTEAVNN